MSASEPARRRSGAAFGGRCRPPGRVVDEDERDAGVGAVLRPTVLAAVDPHELAQTLAARPRLAEAPAPGHEPASTIQPPSVSAASAGPKSG